MNRLIVPLMLLCFLIQVRIAAATPVVVLRDEFAALQSGRTVIVEDFQGFDPIGALPSPVHLANGKVSAVGPAIGQLADGSRVISFAGYFTDFTVISDFPPGTIAWGTGISVVPLVSDPYDIEIIGRSGTTILDDYGSQFFFGPDGFFGVHDPEGLIEVRIRAAMFDGFYTLHDIQTTLVPEPAGVALGVFASAILIVWIQWARR
jgi:hypothetical protein